MQRQPVPAESKEQQPVESSIISELRPLVERYSLAQKKHADEEIKPEITRKIWDTKQYKLIALDEEGNNALHLAVMQNDFRMVRFLREYHNLSKANDRNNLGKSPATLAADQGNLFIERYIRSLPDDREQLFRDAWKPECSEEESKQLSVYSDRADEALLRFRNAKSRCREELDQLAEKNRGKIKRTSDYMGYSGEESNIKASYNLDDLWKKYQNAWSQFEIERARLRHLHCQEGADKLNKQMQREEPQDRKNTRRVLAGDVSAIVPMIDYHRDKKRSDYGRAMIFSCIAAVSCPNAEEHQRYIKDLNVDWHKESRSWRKLRAVLLDLLSNDKLLVLKNRHPKLDPITLILLAVENIKNNGTPEEKKHVEKGEEKLISSSPYAAALNSRNSLNII